MKGIFPYIAAGTVVLLAVMLMPMIVGDKPIQRVCPDQSPNGERLAYATYHGQTLICTYIAETRGAAKRTIP